MLKIVTYKPKYKPDFIRLSKAWLTEYFEVEPHDLDIFGNIEERIINPGGQIFFAISGDEVAGTVAMEPKDQNNIELAKMAVAKAHQGLGIASKLMETAINFAAGNEYNYIFLLSNRKLKKALHLYEKFGFKEVPITENDYSRTDIQMKLTIEGVNNQI